jgi:hypothetical protein
VLEKIWRKEEAYDQGVGDILKIFWRIVNQKAKDDERAFIFRK